MSAAVILRVAALLAMLQWGAHTALFVLATPRHGADEVAVIEAMKSHHFDFLGASRSYWDFYYGYGLMAAVFCLVEAILFWQLAGAASVARPLVRSVAVLFLAFNVGHALLAARFFFITPIVPDVLIAGCLATAIVVLRG